MVEDEVAFHADLASRLGKQCAIRRAEYYGRIAEAYTEQACRAERVSAVYSDRAIVADAGDCDE